MTLSNHPLFYHLESAKRVLIAGAGGGFDVYCGLPLYLSLRSQGKEVYLANYSFTQLELTDATEIYPDCYEVTAETKEKDIWASYFPEKYLCQWLLSQDICAPVYAFKKTGVQPLKRAYEHLIKILNIDAILLVDGGTDSLMFGDEEGLGTPIEDIISMAAVYQTDIPLQFLISLGFGVDHFHGVSHYRFLENVAALIRTGGFFGTFSLLQTSEEGRQYMEAVAFVTDRMKWTQSIVSNSIVSAMEGQFGDHHATNRTEGSELWINPLMSLYWCFWLPDVIALNQYFPLIRNTNTLRELSDELFFYRNSLPGLRTSRDMPI